VKNAGRKADLTKGMCYTALVGVHRQGVLESLGLEDPAVIFARLGLSPLDKPDCWPEGMSEMEAGRRLERLLNSNAQADAWPCFLGGGVYRHFIPAAVEEIAAKTEFWTPHLPAHPEIFQGVLTALFEYQSLLARLSGLEAACCPVGGPGEALAGAILAAFRRRPEGGRILVASSVNPFYLNQARQLVEPWPVAVHPLGFTDEGLLDRGELDRELDDQVMAVVVQCPNHFGLIENLPALTALAETSQAVLIEVVADPVSLGLLKSPGQLGFDLACGDLTGLGLPLSGEGSGAGFVAATCEFKDMLPGRLVAETEDVEGMRVFIDVTDHLSSGRPWRHLFSTNLLAGVRVAAHLSLLGDRGLERMARLTRERALLARRLARERNLEMPLGENYFNEFPIHLSAGSERVEIALRKAGILAGVPLNGTTWLFAFNELHEEADLVQLMDLLAGLS